ncbi:MAG: energy transducer TonB, partial [Proteobacteria bacterium]|nr:energy transducer TonB [Pseudomonadota bacterium]
MNVKVSSADRNTLTLTLSVLLLAVVILGISFSYDESPDQLLHSMDVILSNKSNQKAPEDAEFLSQNNQLGGGNQEQKTRPQNLVSAISPAEDGNAPINAKNSIKNTTIQPVTQVLTSPNSKNKVVNLNKAKEKKKIKSELTTNTENLKMAKIEDEIAKKIEQYAKKPRSKYISSSSKAYEYAPYINGWVQKIEKTGDLNFPEKAKRSEFTGNVMLTVGINRDGSLHSVKLVKTSGFNFLDEAAKHIVKLAAPFEALPPTDENIDILYYPR